MTFTRFLGRTYMVVATVTAITSIATSRHWRRLATSYSFTELEVAREQYVSNMTHADLDPEGDGGAYSAASVMVHVAERAPEGLPEHRHWWHTVVTCPAPHYNEDGSEQTIVPGINVTHEDQGWARTREAAAIAAHEAAEDLLCLTCTCGEEHDDEDDEGDDTDIREA